MNIIETAKCGEYIRNHNNRPMRKANAAQLGGTTANLTGAKYAICGKNNLTLLEEAKEPIVLPLQLRRKQSSDSKVPQYTVISERQNYNENGVAGNVSQQRTLEFECNFCHEQIATFLSLTTHIKSHRRAYCKQCYWILLENETMKQHIDNCHRIDRGTITNI